MSPLAVHQHRELTEFIHNIIALPPHAEFIGKQKMDLGACPKSHTERLKTEFLAAKEETPNDPKFARFQAEYESNIFAFVDECDRRIRAAHRRLEKTPEENAKTTNLVCGVLKHNRERHRGTYMDDDFTFLLLRRCVKSRKLSLLFREGRRRLSSWVTSPFSRWPSPSCSETSLHFNRRTRSGG